MRTLFFFLAWLVVGVSVVPAAGSDPLKDLDATIRFADVPRGERASSYRRDLLVTVMNRGRRPEKIWGLTNRDLHVASPGAWTLLTQPERIIVTGTGNFGTQSLAPGQAVHGLYDLASYFDKITAGENRVGFRVSIHPANGIAAPHEIEKDVTLFLTPKAAAAINRAIRKRIRAGVGRITCSPSAGSAPAAIARQLLAANP